MQAKNFDLNCLCDCIKGLKICSIGTTVKRNSKDMTTIYTFQENIVELLIVL